MKLQIITGSVREGSLGSKVGQWIEREASKIDGIEPELLDLHDWPLPLYNEAMPPLMANGNYKNDTGRRWAQKISEGDAYVILTPEYNHGYSAAVKNAIDWLGAQWHGKPVLLAGYSMTPHAGIRGVEQLKPVLSQVKLMQLAHNIVIPAAHEHIDDSGKFKHDELSKELARSLKDLTELQKKLS